MPTYSYFEDGTMGKMQGSRKMCKGLKTKEVHKVNNLDQKLFLQNAVWLICVV